MNDTQSPKRLNIEDAVHTAVQHSVELMADLQECLQDARGIGVTWCNLFCISSKLRSLQDRYHQLSQRFRDTFILSPERRSELESGSILNMEKGYYSYLLSALPVVLRENLKRDPNIQNMEIVLVGLAAQSLSYENMLGRLQSVLQEINNEIHLHRQEVASRQMLFLNAFMLLLTAINIWLAARSFVVTHNELPMLSLS